jgi:predicted metal-dependent HD superfamily phosphohydrolase
MKDLEDLYFSTAETYCSDSNLITDCFKEISSYYNSVNRYYHNAEHLQFLIKELIDLKPQISDWNLISFAVFYHDVIYDVTENDNEERSAKFAENHLLKLGCPVSLIENVKSAIIATKDHSPSENNDINLLIDSDLSILGTDYKTYKKYSQKIRYEYLIYPSFLYDKGRIQAIRNIADKEFIYKTKLFREKYETNAKENIRQELATLKKINYKSIMNDGTYIQYIEEDGNFHEFFFNAWKILDLIDGVEKLNAYGGWHDNGYYRMNYEGVKLHLEYDGMMGTWLKTEKNPAQNEIESANELFNKLLNVRLTEKDLMKINTFIKKNS